MSAFAKFTATKAVAKATMYPNNDCDERYFLRFVMVAFVRKEVVRDEEILDPIKWIDIETKTRQFFSHTGFVPFFSQNGSIGISPNG